MNSEISMEIFERDLSSASLVPTVNVKPSSSAIPSRNVSGGEQLKREALLTKLFVTST